MASRDTSANQLSLSQMKSCHQVLIGRRIIVFFFHICDAKGRPTEISLLKLTPIALIQLIYMLLIFATRVTVKDI